MRELIRHGKADLEIIKQSPGYDIDILRRAKALRKMRTGMVAMERNFGLARYHRRAIESGAAKLGQHPNLHSGPTAMTGYLLGGSDGLTDSRGHVLRTGDLG